MHRPLWSVLTLVLASLAFSLGGVFMKTSAGFTHAAPSAGVALCFVVGAVLLTRAVHTGGLTTTYVIGLGLEAVVSVGVGLLLFGERVSPGQIGGLALILGGLAVVRIA